MSEPNRIPEVVVDRSKWVRGEGPRNSALLVSATGKMCCLGFVAKHEGYSDAQINDVSSPGGLRFSQPDHKARGLIASLTLHLQDADGTIQNTHLCKDMMHTNDDASLSDGDREHALAFYAQEVGFMLKFVDSLPNVPVPAYPNNASEAWRDLV